MNKTLERITISSGKSVSINFCRKEGKGGRREKRGKDRQHLNNQYNSEILYFTAEKLSFT